MIKPPRYILGTGDNIMSLEILSIQRAAEYLGVLPLTLRNWEKKGKISPFRTLGGHRRYRKSDLDAIINRNKSDKGLGSVIETIGDIDSKLSSVKNPKDLNST